MPHYKLIRRFEDGHEEESDFQAAFGAGIGIGKTIPLDDGQWMVEQVLTGDTPTLIVTPTLTDS